MYVIKKSQQKKTQRYRKTGEEEEEEEVTQARASKNASLTASLNSRERKRIACNYQEIGP
jgi:hypothetical protein